MCVVVDRVPWRQYEMNIDCRSWDDQQNETTSAHIYHVHFNLKISTIHIRRVYVCVDKLFGSTYFNGGAQASQFIIIFGSIFFSIIFEYMKCVYKVNSGIFR